MGFRAAPAFHPRPPESPERPGRGAADLSIELRRSGEQVARLRAERDRLATQLESCARQERMRLAEALHDGVAQDLFVARQELAEAQDGRVDSLARVGDALDSASRELRRRIADLYPPERGHGE